MTPIPVNIIGGGLAGCEAAWQISRRGFAVRLFEMRPLVNTGAHSSENLAELVCSNSLGSRNPIKAPGLLKEELRLLNSLLLKCAEESAIPAGDALAVDRDLFSESVTKAINSQQNIEVVRQEVKKIPQDGMTVIASGPLTSAELAKNLRELTGRDSLFFFDAIAPVVSLDSIDMTKAFRASRYGRSEQEEGDYINCPFSKEEYEQFIHALLEAEQIPLHEFEKDISGGVNAGAGEYFEGCLPVEIMARRDIKALSYGPMRPVGLRDPLTGKRPYAVVQLRQDNLAGTNYNLVGFQTNLTYSEQARVLRLIPGLESAEFVRFGQMHRNTFIASPLLLHPTLQSKLNENLFFAGQITGIEGYMGNISSGLLAGLNLVQVLSGRNPLCLPETTMIGALCHYITHCEMKHFQPMKANFGILPPLGEIRNKLQRAQSRSDTALLEISTLIQSNPDLFPVNNDSNLNTSEHISS